MRIDELGSGNYYILCLCEGTAEEDVMNWLLDNHKLIFDRRDLIDGCVIRRKKVERIQEEYLSLDFAKPLVILRVIDSRREKFTLGRAYQERYQDKVLNIHTNPEIEILMIIHRGDYERYLQREKSSIKPSDFCTREYKISGIKRQGTFRRVFGDIEPLVHAIENYHSSQKGELALKDLLKIKSKGMFSIKIRKQHKKIPRTGSGYFFMV